MDGKGFAALLAAAAMIAAPLALASATPAQASQLPTKAKKKAKVAIEASETSEKLRTNSLTSFTPSLVDPSRAAGIRAQTAERTFRFTPSGKVGDRKALTLGLTSRVVTTADPIRAAADPVRTTDASAKAAAGYNVGLSVGWQGFSVSGGYSQLENAFGLRRESVDLGLSYRGKNWKTTLQAAAEEPSHLALDPLALDKRYSVELGGAYSFNSRISVQGGMRYQHITPLDPRLTNERSDPSVYLGTAFRF